MVAYLDIDKKPDMDGLVPTVRRKLGVNKAGKENDPHVVSVSPDFLCHKEEKRSR